VGARLDVAMDSLSAASLSGWTPIRVSTTGEPQVDWAIVDETFSDAFFEQTIERAMRRPFNRIFARRTTLSALEGGADATGLEPNGFIFHMSRCGSTLLSQMLAQLSATIVLSEPQPFDALLRLRGRLADLNEETLAGWLRAMIRATVRPRPDANRLFVKFYAWHVLELPLIARAFPEVPWIFVFREPRAVLGSQAKSPGAEVVAGTIDPRLLEIDPSAAFQSIPSAEYVARTLSAFCTAALSNKELGRSAFIDYATLPDIVLSGLAEFFGVAPTAEEAKRMLEVTRLDPKDESEVFRPRAEKDASGAIDGLATQWLDEPYRALRALALQ